MKKQLNLKTAYVIWADVPSDETKIGVALEFYFDAVPFGLWVDVYGTYDEELINYFTDEECDEFINLDSRLEFFEKYLEDAYHLFFDFEITKEDGKYFIEYEEN